MQTRPRGRGFPGSFRRPRCLGCWSVMEMMERNWHLISLLVFGRFTVKKEPGNGPHGLFTWLRCPGSLLEPPSHPHHPQAPLWVSPVHSGACSLGGGSLPCPRGGRWRPGGHVCVYHAGCFSLPALPGWQERFHQQRGLHLLWPEESSAEKPSAGLGSAWVAWSPAAGVL